MYPRSFEDFHTLRRCSSTAKVGLSEKMTETSDIFQGDNSLQDIWLADEAQGPTLLSNGSIPSRSEIGNTASEYVTGKHTPSSSTGKGPVKTPGVLRTGNAALLRDGNSTLPAEKAFAIQIGWKLFRLSGTSIMSDGKLKHSSWGIWIYAEPPKAPSYFSTYFEEQLRLAEQGAGEMKTLFIDRDPDTFEDICRHLQGIILNSRNMIAVDRS